MRQRNVRKRPNVSPEVVVRTALELLDAEGMEGVTFRAVAKKLGIQPPPSTGTSRTRGTSWTTSPRRS